MMTVFAALFGWLLPAKSQPLSEIDFSFSKERVFTPAFVATCLRPIGYSISFEEEEGILVFENEDKSITIRLSSMIIGSDIDPASAFNSSKNVSADETILNLDETTKRIVLLKDHAKFDENYMFYMATISQYDKVILLSITANTNIFVMNKLVAERVLKDISMNVKIYGEDEKSKIFDSLYDGSLNLKMNAEERDEVYIIRNHAIRLIKAIGLEYPPSVAQLDQLFGRVAERPELFTGMQAAKIVLGLAFGDLLVKEFGFDWTYIKDDVGEELAVTRGQADDMYTIFPMSAVQKRDLTTDAGFMTAIVEDIPKITAPN